MSFFVFVTNQEGGGFFRWVSVILFLLFFFFPRSEEEVFFGSPVLGVFQDYVCYESGSPGCFLELFLIRVD